MLTKQEILNSIKIFDKSGTELKWDYNEFPDGQVQFKIDNHYDIKDCSVMASISNPTILDLCRQFIENIDYHGVKKFKMVYMYGSRSDKDYAGDDRVANVAKMTHNEFLDYVNDLECVAPHCDMEFGWKSNFDLPDELNLSQYDLIVFPDESAKKRFGEVSSSYIVCAKKRDQSSGNIIQHVVPELPEGVKNVIVMDDLGDGLSTFYNVKNNLPDGVKADLFIFHGVFSGEAIPKVFNYYENVFVSNSLPHVQFKADIINQWKNNTISYQQACEQLGVKNYLQYKDIKLGNLIIFDVWK